MSPFDGYTWNERVQAWVLIDSIGDHPSEPDLSRFRVMRPIRADVVLNATDPAGIEEALTDICDMMSAMMVGPETQHLEVPLYDREVFGAELMRAAQIVGAGVPVVLHPIGHPPDDQTPAVLPGV